MNKAQLIDAIAEKVSVNKKQAEEMVECFIETIVSTLKSGGEVNITSFGTFMAKHRAARMGVNPLRPTEKIQISAVTVPKFKAGKGLKDALKHTGKARSDDSQQAVPSSVPEVSVEKERETPAPEATEASVREDNEE